MPSRPSGPLSPGSSPRFTHSPPGPRPMRPQPGRLGPTSDLGRALAKRVHARIHNSPLGSTKTYSLEGAV
jgi:hypothetical protein